MSEFSDKPVRGVQFDLVDLPPEGVDLSGSVPADEIGLEDEERLRFPVPVEYRLHLEPINGGNDLLVRGSVATEAEAVCDRCEERYRFPIAADDLCYEFEKPFGTTVDLSDGLREDILTALPQRFLCREDCQGLCPVCGTNWNTGSCDCYKEEDEFCAANPWSALDALAPENADAQDEENDDSTPPTPPKA